MSPAPEQPVREAIVPVIIAGGSGTRLWPLSRDLYPKQFLSLAGRPSPLQQTLLRVGASRLPGDGRALVICNEQHRFLVREQAAAVATHLREIVLEPEGRNTAPALTAAAARAGDGDPILVVMPADHDWQDDAGYARCLELAIAAAADGSIVTLGVVPTRPETGYGYIRIGAGSAGGVATVLKFVEKPQRVTAEDFLRAGDYLWNSGVFVLRRSTWYRALQRYQPDLHRLAFAAVAGGQPDDVFFRVQREAFLACPRISIDYAVMEPASIDPEFRCRVVPLASGWSDIGSWQSLWERESRDANGNVCIGDTVVEGTRNSLVVSQGRLVAVMGCENLAIVETADAVLVAELGQAQRLSALVERLKSDHAALTVSHRLVHRPWGNFESLDQRDRYQVKRLTLQPGKQLSLQRHRHRAEHWVVVRGTATVTRGDATQQLKENESIYIPQGTVHRLANLHQEVLEVIEVQTGAYLGEDDIERLDDDFGRAPTGAG
jgi:mannose-1-phosphate guanylyltransferase/mannose-6-phosphate isomerase